MRKRLVAVVTSAAVVAAFLTVITGQTANAAAGVDDFAQCENGTGTALNCPGGWTHGALQGSNSHYHEDQVVPQRLVITPGDTSNHTFTFEYQTRKGTIHAYDSLATWNLTQATADPCQGISATLCAGAPSTFQMASDSTSIPPVDAGISAVTSTHELPALSRQWTIYGGAITATSAITHDSPAAGDDDATAGFTFHANTASTSVVILFGGHLAVSGNSSIPRAWGVGRGATNVSGGPYHVKLGDYDGGSAGATSNSIQAGALAPGAPNFTITKTASPANPVAPNSTVTYTITVTNTGTGSGPVTFTDNFDDRLSPTIPTSVPSGATCVREPVGNTDRLFTCNTTVIPSGNGQQVFTYTAVMPDNFTGPVAETPCVANQYKVSNTATLTTGGTPATANVCVQAAATFTISKTANPLVANPGDPVEYTVTVHNTGSAAGSTSFTDNYDDALTLTDADVTAEPDTGTWNCDATSVLGDEVLQCTTSSIGPGEQQEFTYTADMPETFTGPSGGGGCASGRFPIHNDATLVGSTALPGSVTVCVNATPSFTIAKTVSDSVAGPGDTVTYTITITNGGAASGSTTWQDDFDDRLNPQPVVVVPVDPCSVATLPGPNKVLNCTTPTILGGGGTFVYQYTAQLPATFSGAVGGHGCTESNPQQYSIYNVATLPDTSSDDATVCVNAAPNFTVTKGVNIATAEVGQTRTYTITVFNMGLASGSTTFVDHLDSRVTIPVQSFPAGWTCAFATVLGEQQLQCTTPVIAALSSASVTYNVVMPATFTTAPEGCNDNNDQYAISNHVILANGNDATATVCVSAAPDLTITKDVDPATAVPGGTVTYTITVTNEGTAPGSTSFVDDYDDRITLGTPIIDPVGGQCTNNTVPNKTLSCDTSTLNPDDTQTFTYTGTMPDKFGTPPTGTNPCGSGKFPVENSVTEVGVTVPADSARVCVTAAPIFTITKSADPMTANPGDPVNYTVTVSNTGNAAGSTSFTDNYDNRLTLSPPAVTISGTGGSCTLSAPLGDKKIDCTTGTIAAGDEQTFKYSVNMPAFVTGLPGTGCGAGQYAFKNTATLVGNAGSAPVTVCLNVKATFTIDKDASTMTTGPGQPVTYTITVHNGGSAPGSTSFTDDFDDRLLVPATVTGSAGGSCSRVVVSLNALLQCTTGDLDPGASETFSYTVNMPSTFTGSAGGSGCTATNPQQYPVNNVAAISPTNKDTITVCVNAAPDFAISKSAQPNPALPDQTVTYIVTVTNNGKAAGTTSFTDDFDDRLSPVLPVIISGTGGSCSVPVGTSLLTCDTGTILSGDSQTFTYTAKMPKRFTGESGTGGCDPGQYPVGNTASLDGTDAQPGSALVCVIAAPDLSIVKSVSPTSATPGDTVTYTITVTNSGAAPGSMSFIDDYDDSLDPSDPTTDTGNGSCEKTTDDGNKVLSCDTDAIEAGKSITFTYTAELPDSFSGTPDAGCTGGEYPVKNVIVRTDASSTVCVSTSPHFVLTKTADPTDALPGQTVNYTIRVTNDGNGPGSTTFVDDYDELVTPDDLETTPPGGTCDTGLIGLNHVLNCETIVLNPTEYQEFTYTVELPGTFTGTPGGGEDCDSDQYPIENTAYITGDEGSVGAEVCVTAKPAFTITKTADTDGPIAAGDTVTYHVTVRNGGTAPGVATFTDDYDDRLTPHLVLPTVPPGGTCNSAVVDDNKVLKCTTISLEANGDQTFTYTAVMPDAFTGDPGGFGCTESNPQQYPIRNFATLDGGAGADPVTVCVNAAPDFSVTKAGGPNPAQPDGLVTYVITVHNGGTAAGSTSFVDNFDNRLTPSTVVISPLGGSCEVVSVDGDTQLECDTGTINAKQDQTFTYTAKMPKTFSDQPGGAGCSANNPQQYPITNSVLLANGANATRTICVNAAPIARTVKSVQASNDTQGNQFLTYTLTYTNTGSADALSTQIIDPMPAGTSFVSCGGGCVEPTPTYPYVVWNLGPTPALTGGGVVTFTVLVTATTFCNVSNTAYLSYDGNDAVASNTVTTVIQPPDNPDGANASGNAVVARVTAAGLLAVDTQPLVPVSSSQHGIGTDVGHNGVLALNIPTNGGKILKLGALYDNSTSVVTRHPAIAFQNTATEIANLCLFPIAGACTIQANVVRSVAGAMATGGWASYSSAGSTITGLKVAGIPVTLNVNQTTKITLNPGLFGAGSYVAINERSGSSGLKLGKWQADLTVTMIHVHVTALLGLEAVEVIVGKAVAHVDFPATLVCGPLVNRSVSGYASAVRLSTLPQLADTDQGYVELPPTGGTEQQHIASLSIGELGKGTLVQAAVADTYTTGTIQTNQVYSMSRSVIAGYGTTPICVIQIGLRCIVTAQAIRTQVQSIGNSAGTHSNDAYSQFIGVRVLGVPIPVRVAPNTVLGIPGIGGLILNEQFCDGGTLTYTHTCVGSGGHVGMTVRALHLIAVIPYSGPLVEVVVAEAHSDVTFRVQAQ